MKDIMYNHIYAQQADLPQVPAAIRNCKPTSGLPGNSTCQNCDK